MPLVPWSVHFNRYNLAPVLADEVKARIVRGILWSTIVVHYHGHLTPMAAF